LMPLFWIGMPGQLLKMSVWNKSANDSRYRLALFGKKTLLNPIRKLAFPKQHLSVK
jgi:hypothetical protein